MKRLIVLPVLLLLVLSLVVSCAPMRQATPQDYETQLTPEELMLRAEGVEAPIRKWGRTALLGATKSVANIPYATLMSASYAGHLVEVVTSTNTRYYYQWDPTETAAEGSWITDTDPIEAIDDAGQDGRWTLLTSFVMGSKTEFTTSYRDSDCTDDDVNVQFWGNCSGTATNAEVCDWAIKAQNGPGAAIDILYYDASANTLLIPHDNNPTVDETGEISWDADEDTFEVYSSEFSAAVLMPPSHVTMPPVIIYEPDEVAGIDDEVPLYFFPEETYPHGVTIRSIHISSSATCTDPLNFEEWTNVPAVESTVEAVTLSGTYTEDDGVLTNDQIDTDSWLYVDLDDTMDDVAFITITVTITINPGD